jgi:hypothetical protein
MEDVTVGNGVVVARAVDAEVEIESVGKVNVVVAVILAVVDVVIGM